MPPGRARTLGPQEHELKVLSLDLASRTGWATNVHGPIESGVQDFALKRGESPGMRFVYFNGWLWQWRSNWRPDVIVYEQNFRRGGAATELAAGFSTRVMEFCAQNGIEHAAVNVATLKKWVTGAGRGDKDAMYAAVCRRGWSQPGWRGTPDHNEVDAICLLHYALSELLAGLTSGRAGRGS